MLLFLIIALFRVKFSLYSSYIETLYYEELLRITRILAVG
jgi:hypothetical protein